MGDRPEVALNHMLRLVARGPVAEQLPIHTHDRLLDKLRRQGVLHTCAYTTQTLEPGPYTLALHPRSPVGYCQLDDCSFSSRSSLILAVYV